MDETPDNANETVMLSSDQIKAMEQIFNRFMQVSRPFGFVRRDSTVQYHPLPYKPEPDDRLLLKQPWRVELELHTGDQRLRLGLDLYGDVILGRGESRPGRIIVDLEPYNARALGVSRGHVMLRPTATRLFAIDQGSRNHTAINSVLSGRGVAAELHDQDMVALGNFVLQLHVIGRPGAAT
jgi:hypothetical protein